MRSGTWVVLLLVAWCTAALAGPPHGKPPAKPPISAADQAELLRLQNEVTQLQIKQQYLPAIKLARQLLDLQIKVSGKDDRQVGYRKQNLATLLSFAGNYSEAIKLYKELVAAAEKDHGPESREVLYALMALTGPYIQQSLWEEVDPLHQRMLAIVKKLNGENSKEYASQLVQYGGILYTHNEYTAAERAYEQALKIDEAVAPSDTMIQSEEQMLGSLYWVTNQRPKAIAMFDRAVDAAKHAKGATPYSIGSEMWAVASQYHFGGRDDLAKPMMKRVLDIYDQEAARLEKDKPDDYQLPMVLGMGGYVTQSMGDFPGAEQRLLHAIAVDEKNPTRAGFSSWTSMLAEVYRQEGKGKEALALLEKAQAAMTKLSPVGAHAYDMSIALILRQTGDFKRAEKLLADYAAFAEKQYGRKSVVFAATEVQLGLVYMSAGDYAKADPVFADALELQEKQLQSVLKTGTEADHTAFFAQNNYMLDVMVNYNQQLAPKRVTTTKLALTTLLRRKGRALDAAASSLAAIRAKLSLEDKQLLDDLASARTQLAKLTVAGPAAIGDPAEYAKEVAALEDQVAKLELAIGKKSAAYRATSLAIDLPAIQKLVPRDARLVEIVNYKAGDLKTPIWVATDKRRYGAYVLGSTGDPVFVDLAEADAIDDAVAKFRKAVSNPDDDRAPELGRALYDLTIAKLQPALGKSTEILIAPDGTLNVVPFSALVDEKGDFLIKKYTFTYLTSGRDLLRIAVRTKARGGGVIFANPTFDNGGKPGSAGSGDAGAQSRGQRSADLASLAWPPLPGTGKEADAVAKTMHGLKEFLGSDATESAVKAVHGPKILHLATHGFFLPDEPPPPPPANDNAIAAPAAMMPGAGAAPMPTESSENPLLRSGLALAGANKLSSGEEDGILTALEASGLDLEGTKLVVLSACETGVGKVTNGDGVYGLRRALVVAGAESLVMSLWQVDDEATKQMMVGYYERLAKGEKRSSALRDIQLQLGKSEKFKHPYYWASFLPAGDNSPIKE
ncbi:MAG TPA: CHAT domain-containing tetratricopeptide repeat protein [Kofleriaceae bacterium]|nr:CHAT domain-containing tetratricopeptide repeat protein [Kofleriaceae bacterium]